MRRSVLSRHCSQNRNQSSSGRKGAALVEMAIVVPIFLTLVLGIIEFGRAMLVSQMVGNASREAARRAVLDDSNSTSIETYVEGFLSSSLGISTSDVTIDFYVNDLLADVNTAVENDKIRARVEIPFDSVSLIGANYLKGKKLVGETTMRHE